MGKPRGRGFDKMSPEEHKQLASKGGTNAQRSGKGRRGFPSDASAKGVEARRKLSPEKRSEIARKAALARWKK